jgi:hypothetical protein
MVSEEGWLFVPQQGGSMSAEHGFARRMEEIDLAVARWEEMGKRYPLYKSEQEVATALDRIGIEWEYVDGLKEHMIVFRCRDTTDKAVSYAFCPDLYLPGYDVYVEITTSGLSWVTKRVKTTQTDCLSIKRHKTALARSMHGQRVVLIYGSRYQRITSRNRQTSARCLHDLLRKYGHPRQPNRKQRRKLKAEPIVA